MKFSVLMSVYAKENPNYFRKSLQSILIDQTHIPDELVLVQDGPLTDELLEVVNEYKILFPNFKTIILENNVGLGEALRLGVQSCSYDWIARMDTDDVADPKRFEKQVSYIKRHPEIDVLGSNIIEFNEDINQVVSEKKLPTTHKGIIKMMTRRNPFCHMTVWIKKESVISAGNYQSLPLVEDYYLWVRMAAQGATFANIGEPLVYARIGNGMHIRRSDKKQINSWRIVNKYMLENGLINNIQYFRNILGIKLFIYTPTSFKKILYKWVLRRR